MVNVLKQIYSPISYMKARYPKAAKKRRILNKWRNKYGEQLDWKKYESLDPLDPIFERVYANEVNGKYYPVPIPPQTDQQSGE
jgi:hypothetical protein